MARYGKEHKTATRARIVETAASRLKTDGIDGAGVAVLMKDAGLTNGAFYGHFDSKDQLVAEVVATELAVQRTRLAAMADGAAGVEQLVRSYLSTAHRDDPAHGCPAAALLDDVARGGEALRQATTDGVLGVVDDIALRLAGPGQDGSESRALARSQALTAYALMVGAVQLARTITDPGLSQQVLEQAQDTVLRMLGLVQPS